MFTTTTVVATSRETTNTRMQESAIFFSRCDCLEHSRESAYSKVGTRWKCPFSHRFAVGIFPKLRIYFQQHFLSLSLCFSFLFWFVLDFQKSLKISVFQNAFNYALAL